MIFFFNFVRIAWYRNIKWEEKTGGSGEPSTHTSCATPLPGCTDWLFGNVSGHRQHCLYGGRPVRLPSAP